MKVLIKRNPGPYSIEGEIDIDEIHDVCWDNVSGGVNKRHAGYSLYGYIDYNRASQLVSCSGTHAHYGSPAKIMIPASLNREKPYREAYLYLLERAGEKPVCHYRRPGLKPCRKRILELLSDKAYMIRKELREILLKEGYGKYMIASALNRMEKQGRIVYLKGRSSSPLQEISKAKAVHNEN